MMRAGGRKQGINKCWPNNGDSRLISALATVCSYMHEVVLMINLVVA